MARFLSAEWMDELTRAAHGDPGLAGAGALRLQQVVTHPDRSVTTYALVMADSGLSVVPGELANPDVTLSADYDTAVAINRGELSAQSALFAGRVRVSGDSSALVRSQAALARAQECWAPVLDRTSY